jgi:hypothetical protein
VLYLPKKVSLWVSTFNTTSAALTAAYGQSNALTFNCNIANSLTTAYSSSITPTFTVSSSGTMTSAYGQYISPTINVTTATVGTAIGSIYGLYVTPAAPTITTASVIVTNYYGVYSGTMAAKTGSGNFTNAYGGYFLTPVTTATTTSSMALYATDASFGAANTTTSPPTNGILVQGNILNQALAINALVGTDGSKNLTTTTSSIAASFASLSLGTPLTVPNGGTGLSACVLGDVFYGSGVNTITNLGGNTTTTKKFFNQTGDGVNSAAPQWSSLVTSDLGTTMTPQFTAIGLGTAASTNAFIVTSARTAAAVSNTYHIWVTGITTGSSSSTLLTGIDISTTNTASGGTLTNAVQLNITPNTDATTNTITNSSAILINSGTNAGGTVTNNYGIYNNTSSYGATNIGYYQTGTFTKATDVGMKLNNTFTPSATATSYSILNSPTMAISSGIVAMTNFYTTQTSPTINVTSATGGISFTGFYGLSVNPTAVTLSGAAHTLTTYYGIYSASPAPTLANGSTITTAYSGYFAAPGLGTTKVALWAADITLNAATAFAPIAVDTNKNMVSLTTGMSNVGYVLTSTGAGSLPTWQAGGAGGSVSSVTGTANQITCSPTTGAVVVSLPSAIITPGSLQTTNTVAIGGTVNTSYFMYITGTPGVASNTMYAQYIDNTITAAAVASDTTLSAIKTNVNLTTAAGNTSPNLSLLNLSGTFTGTDATITATYGILLNTPSFSGTTTTGYGIYNNVPVGANTNIGYYQTGTFTKAADVGLQLTNTFTPTANGGTLYQFSISPTFNTTSNTIASAYGSNNTPTFNCNSANNLTTAYTSSTTPTFTVSSSGTITSAYSHYISPTINVTTATVGTAISGVYGLYITPAAPTITTASVVVTNYYGLYSGTMPAKTGSGNFANAYGAYLLEPVTTATTTSSMALFATNATFGIANVAISPPTNGILVQGNILNQALSTNSLVGTDGSKNLTTTTSGITPTLAGLTLTAALTVPNGGTGLNSSTLGSMFYGSGSNTMANLTGNITTTKKFFTQTGDGVNSAAPAWNTLVTSDLGTTLTPQFSAIGLGTAASTNAYIVTSARTAAAVASTYHIQLTGTTTGSSSSTLLSTLDISTTNTPNGATLTTSTQIQLTPNTNATSNNITSSYGMLINAGANTAGTVTNSFGAYITTPGFGTNKVALYSDSLQVGGTSVSGAITAGTIKVGAIGAGVICASAALAVSATGGFLYIPSLPGGTSGNVGPTGTPTTQTGTTPLAYDTDNSQLYLYNGAWRGVGECLIQKQTVSGVATATITFSSIPQTYNRLKIIIVGQWIGASTANVLMTFNSVATGYDHQKLSANNATLAGQATANDTRFILPPIPGDTLTANKPAIITVDIPEYVSTTWYKGCTSYGISADVGGSSCYMQLYAGTNRATTAVTRIDLTNSGGNFKAGSVFYLYGIM